MKAKTLMVVKHSTREMMDRYPDVFSRHRIFRGGITGMMVRTEMGCLPIMMSEGAMSNFPHSGEFTIVYSTDRRADAMLMTALRNTELRYVEATVVANGDDDLLFVDLSI
jgi:hypothetical protein